jgi:hypothetical protein
MTNSSAASAVGKSANARHSASRAADIRFFMLISPFLLCIPADEAGAVRARPCQSAGNTNSGAEFFKLNTA